MDKVDPAPVIALFNEFFTLAYKPKIDELLLVYPGSDGRKKSLNVDFRDLERFDSELADKLIREPDLVVSAAEEAIKQLNLRVPSGVGQFDPHIRFFNLPNADDLIEKIGSKEIGTLVTFKGVVTKRAEVMHKVKVAAYSCEMCDEHLRVHVTKNFIPPKKCPNCKKFALKQVDEDSNFVDIQRAEVQELLEKVRGSAPTARMELLTEDDLVNILAPGENVEIVGVLRLRPPLKARGKQELVYTRYVDVLHLKSMKRDFEEIDISKEDEKRILEFSRMDNIERFMVEAVAPAIYGHEEVKHAIVLQLFGGTKGKKMKGGAPIRDDIHILMIGDPGLAKTRFLQQAGDIAPKSIYVSGKTVSGVGLTVAAEKDDLGEGGWTLKAGALVLASGGFAGIDEFDKIDDEDRAALHEVMESQRISIAKAGMVATFVAKCAILSAANPKYGRFDQNKNLAEQFDVPPTLLSRFDLIFPIVDVLDPEKDARLAQHILETHMGKFRVDMSDQIDKEFLRKYIAYARRSCFPRLTNEALDKIREFYVDMRRMGKDIGSVTITPRYLEGLVRLAEANSKIRLSPTVEAKDAEIAINLMRFMMQKIMTDKATGAFDVDVVATGKPKSEREKLQKSDTIIEIIRQILKDQETAESDRVVEIASTYDIDEPTARRLIDDLIRKGDIYYKMHGHLKIVGEK